jgi:hypothetical protein
MQLSSIKRSLVVITWHVRDVAGSCKSFLYLSVLYHELSISSVRGGIVPFQQLFVQMSPPVFLQGWLLLHKAPGPICKPIMQKC